MKPSLFAGGASRDRRALQVFRVGSLVLPSAVAWEVASLALRRTALDAAVARALGPLWLATVAMLVLRAGDALLRRRRAAHADDATDWLDAADVLTATGSSMAWSGALAVLAAVGLGWASLSVVGMFGLGVVHVAALWTLVRAAGSDPWRRASLTRRFVPDRATEGDHVVEEVHLTGPRIPAGFRLLAEGRVAPRWPVTRYTAAAGDCGGDAILRSDVGPAARGAHDAEPLVVWLQDVLGICHSPRVVAGRAKLTVLPRAARVDGAQHLLSAPGDGPDARPATRLPTEGSLRLREYAPGDDARRIHWLRSLTADRIVVRLPDEIPRDRPGVRLVLDTFHPALAAATPCGASETLLDALVRVWLGAARSLAAGGVRVDAVAPAYANGAVEAICRRLPVRDGEAGRAVRMLGASATWQGALRARDMIHPENTIVVSYRLPVDDVENAARWIVVPTTLWAPEPEREPPLTIFHAFPLGSADNRSSRRHRAATRRRHERDGAASLHVLTAHSQALRAGHAVATPCGPERVRLEVLR